MRLIDVDAFKAYYCMADECKDCKTPTSDCRYDRVYTKMDFCSWLDDAPTIEPVATCDGCRYERLRQSWCEYCMRRFADHYEPSFLEEKFDYA